MRLDRVVFYLAIFAVLFVLTVSPSGSARNLQDTDAAMYNDQGVALFNRGKFLEAVIAFQHAIKLKPDYAQAHHHLGGAYAQLGEFKKAVDAYKHAVRHQPNFVLAYNNLGTAYYKLGEHKKAIEAYHEATRLDPKAPVIRYNLGVVYAERDNEQAALAEYKVLQTLDPKLAQDLYNLIYKPMVTVVADGVVRLNVIAVDARGAPVNGLTSDDFQVLEDGAPQTVTVSAKGDARAVYGVSIDTSGSFRLVFPLAVAAAKAIIAKTLPQDATLLVRFISSDKIETVQQFTSDKKLLTNGIDSLYVEGGQSAVLDAVYISAQSIASHQFPDKSVRRVLFLLTDGDDRASYYTIEKLSTLLRRIDVQIFAISLSGDDPGKLNRNQPKRSADLLRKLASETGGEAFFPQSGAEVTLKINQIFDLVRGEYSIEYKPTKPIEAGIYRPVTVTILPKPGRENWTVTTRAGYVFSPR